MGVFTATGRSAAWFNAALENQVRVLTKSKRKLLSKPFSAARTPPAQATRRKSRIERRAPFGTGFISPD